MWYLKARDVTSDVCHTEWEVRASGIGQGWIQSGRGPIVVAAMAWLALMVYVLTSQDRSEGESRAAEDCGRASRNRSEKKPDVPVPTRKLRFRAE